MNAPYSGFKALGEVIGGSGAPAQGSDAYLSGLTGGYRAQQAGYGRDKAREDARIARLMATAREAIPEALQGAGYQENMQPLLSAILQGNRTMNLNQLGDYAVVEAGPAFTASAEAAQAGNTEAQNRQMALARGQQYEPYSVAGGGDVLLNAGTGDTKLTDLGQAAVLAQEALAGARQASAAASEARADLTSRTDPNRSRATTSAENTELEQAREAVQAGADPKMVAEMLRKRGFPAAARKLYEAPDGR